MGLILPNPPNQPGLMLASSSYSNGDLQWRSPGVTNLLTSNQASFEDGATTGWTRFYAGGSPAAISVSSAQAASGSRSLAVPVATFSSTSVDVGIGTGGDYVSPVPIDNLVLVAPSRVYTATAAVRGDIACGARLSIAFWKSDGSTASGTASASSAVIQTSTSAWQTLSVSLLAPTDAAYAMLYIRFSDTTAGTQYIDKAGLWEGYGGTWAMPGEPIQGIGERWDESVGRRCFMWDSVNNREQMVYGDTGWRVNPGWFGADWDESTFFVRRVGYAIHTYGYVKRVTVGGNINGTAFTALVSGWRDGSSPTCAPIDLLLASSHYLANLSYGSIGGNQFHISPAGVTLPATWAANDRVHFPRAWMTFDGWPATLPGTASGTIPYN